MIELQTLSLTKYDEKYNQIKEELENGISSSKYIHQIKERLENSNKKDKTIYNSAFIVLEEKNPIGYLFISSMINDEVFIEYSILKEYRQKGYGKKVVNEISDYLFENNNIKSIILDIDPSNKNSMLLASSCGFFFDEDDYEERNFVGKMRFIKESNCYINKRRNR